MERKAVYHLPGLFEFYELYRRFLPLYRSHREYFYEWCRIGSIYGAPSDCLWAGGRVEESIQDPEEVLALLREYGISARLTFSNSLLQEKHLADPRCNRLCRIFETSGEKVPLPEEGKKEQRNQKGIHGYGKEAQESQKVAWKEGMEAPENGIIITSDLLLQYLWENYPGFYFVSSTTKVLTEFEDFRKELEREEFCYVVPDFRLNKELEKLRALPQEQKDKVEFLCNECCWFGCRDRKACYDAVSRKCLGMEGPEHYCKAPDAGKGYRFSAAMENPGFISLQDIRDTYLPMGFTNFKIEGRSLGSALVLEFLLYYMTKPRYQVHVREALYLDNMLDLF